ncbi:hypothetical protein HYW54_00010 [Candidatus Gottesmanbacteria bacterium]|nr:hypothetical protein [Candidatus Gottesmanbacteria bacterium]
MLYTPHFLTGAAILKLIPNPYIGLPLALVSHFLLDLTPHNDFDIKPGATMKSILSKENKRRYFMLSFMAIDAVLMIISAYWIFSSLPNSILLLSGGVAGIMPDLVEQILLVFGKAIPGWQDKLQWRVSVKYGFITYPVVCLISLYILTRI